MATKFGIVAPNIRCFFSYLTDKRLSDALVIFLINFLIAAVSLHRLLTFSNLASHI